MHTYGRETNSPSTTVKNVVFPYTNSAWLILMKEQTMPLTVFYISCYASGFFSQMTGHVTKIKCEHAQSGLRRAFREQGVEIKQTDYY